MALSEPLVVQIADRLVELLSTIKDDATAYWTKPKTVMRGVPAEGVKYPQPALFVSIGPITPEGVMTNQWRDTAEFFVVCLTTDSQEPENELHRLVRDVRKVIRANRLLANAAGTQLTRYFREGPIGEEAAHRPSGIGVTTVTALADYQTDADNP